MTNLRQCVRELWREPSRAELPGWAMEAPSHLEEGLAELAEFIREVGGGRIGTPNVRGRDVHVPLVARDGERYILRMRVGAYLAEPPRCAFVDDHYAVTEDACPYHAPGTPFRSPTFICTPPTAEFYVFHGRTYRHGEGSLVATVATIFAALHAPEYAGRARRR